MCVHCTSSYNQFSKVCSIAWIHLHFEEKMSQSTRSTNIWKWIEQHAWNVCTASNFKQWFPELYHFINNKMDRRLWVCVCVYCELRDGSDENLKIRMKTKSSLNKVLHNTPLDLRAYIYIYYMLSEQWAFHFVINIERKFIFVQHMVT